MNNIKLVIEYDGTNYAGWQQQKKEKTVQETLKKAIEKVVNEKITLHGAGRTDAGAHALGQVANFETKANLSTCNLIQAINFYLPKDIVVKSAKRVSKKFHSRYSAKSKIYRYTILNNSTRCAINKKFCYYYNADLDIEKMQMASKALMGKHDFSTFKSKSDNTCPTSPPAISRAGFRRVNSVRTIKKLEIKKKGKHLLFTIEADGFLYKMVRSIVGTLLEVGRGKLTIKEFKRILKSGIRSKAGATVPARGLCLLKVKY
ncbi:MAG: tRNA pseudouridine synthase I [Candidatus Scalindua rubra]|uniref:tRNA pseudouridine synthase A n=1 Tax=Candidatus Scalindua rubra TaxID=1872076 RepID=A0A1E3XC21_9BACT|nr:MAG: tRNA pseudouridine synthase I [Candidatus Scalindua rubra]